MVADLNERVGKDLEAEFGLGSVGRVELRVDLAGSRLAEDVLAVNEGTVADV